MFLTNSIMIDDDGITGTHTYTIEAKSTMTVSNFFLLTADVQEFKR